MTNTIDLTAREIVEALTPEQREMVRENPDSEFTARILNAALTPSQALAVSGVHLGRTIASVLAEGARGSSP